MASLKGRLSTLPPSLKSRRTLLVVVIILFLVLLLVLLLTITGGSSEREPEPRGESTEVRTLIPPEEAFLPNERERLLELEPEPYREPRTPWPADLVDQFWNPVRETAVEALTDQAEEEVEQIFESVD